MKKIVILSCMGFSLFAAGDYIPLSELSDDEKVGYNFANKKDIAKPVESKNYTNISTKNNEIIQPIENNKIKDVNKVQENEPNSEVAEKENIIEEFKKENILQDVSKENKILKADNRDFSITPKISYSFLKTEVNDANSSVISKTSNEFLPEISLSYKNNTIKSDILKFNISDNSTGNTLDTNWYKIAYLYRYLNANIGLAYNKFEFSINSENNVEEFPTIELNLKNIDHQFQADYGVSYGKNNDINHAYEYYLNFGYRLFNNESLVFIAGYKNKIIEDDSSKFVYKGPLIGVSSVF